MNNHLVPLVVLAIFARPLIVATPVSMNERAADSQMILTAYDDEYGDRKPKDDDRWIPGDNPHGPNPHGPNPHGEDPHDEQQDPRLPANDPGRY